MCILMLLKFIHTHSFSKYIGVIDDGQDLDLNDTLYRIYNAYGSGRGKTLCGLHVCLNASAQVNC